MGMVLRKEMRPKCQVATHEASAHYVLFGATVDHCDKRSLFVLV